MQQEEFRLTEEESLLINKNEKIANKNIIQKELIFKALLNEYLKTQRKEQYEAANVPNDGSCLYHAIILSFAAKYDGHQLEINHQKMREKVAIHMLRGQENTEYLRNFAMNENDDSSSSSNRIIIDMCNNSFKKAVQKRYIKYAKSHMNNTHHWPIELCLHIVAELYNLDLTVLQEVMDPKTGQPSGYICERLRSVGLGLLLTATSSSSSSSSSSFSSATKTTSTATTSNYQQLLPSSSPTAPTPQSITKETKAIIIGPSSSPTPTPLLLLPPPPPPPPQSTTRRETKAIIIGNRWDQHYYSIGIIFIVVCC
jgi:hypothetical protein